MTSKFEDFLKNTKKEPAEVETGIEIDGGFNCNICGVQVDEPAYWYPEKKLLVWTCPEGHKSDIKDFKGF